MSSQATARRTTARLSRILVCLTPPNPCAGRALHGDPDLRGYGYTEKPYDGYDKRTMAPDIRELMATLGYDRAAVVGHGPISPLIYARSNYPAAGICHTRSVQAS